MAQARVPTAGDAVVLARARALLRSARAVVPHTDADGLAAGAIALRARGEGADAAILIGRGQTPFDRGAPLPPPPVAVLDWGVRELPAPALLVDHHGADPVSDAHVVVSGEGERPETCTAALMRRIVPEAPAWLAAVGALGDLGAAGMRLPECAGAPRTAVRKLVPLVNAARRLPDGPVRDALALLVESEDADTALRDPRIAVLAEARREWRAAFERAMRTPPAVNGDLALIRFASPYQIHPLVATAWQRRLAPRVVLAANDGYLPGRVNFAVRGGGEVDLRARLRAALPDPDRELGRGHARATGGSLPPDEFDRLVVGLRAAAAETAAGDDEPGHRLATRSAGSGGAGWDRTPGIAKPLSPRASAS